MIAHAGHTLQLGEKDERDCDSGALFTRVTLECTCGAQFANELLPNPTGPERARIRALGWDASQEHLRKAKV